MPVQRCFFPLVAALLLGTGCFSGTGWAQNLPSASPGTSGNGTLHLHGAVVDGITGKPVARALVTSTDRRLATMTNAEGVFTLEVVLSNPAANPMLSRGALDRGGFRIFLQAQKPGYLPPVTPTSVSLNASSAEETLKLMPSGMVSGHVDADTAQSPRDVTVALLQHTSNDGQAAWVTSGMQRTDRNGAFHFSDLRPGEYTVMTTEWRGDEPLPPSPDAITEQYPPVYFGDAATIAGATRLHLHYGESVQTDLHLRPARYYPVSVPLGGVSGGVNVQINGGEAASGYSLGYNPAHHAVEGSLPSGTYALRVSCMGLQKGYGEAVLHVANAPMRGTTLPLLPPLPISVRFHTEFTSREAPQNSFSGRIYLQPEEPPGAFATGSPKPGENELVLADVAPGHYRVRVEASYGYVASVQSGGEDLLAEPLVVTGGQALAPIDVTVRDDHAKVSGTVGTNQQPVPDGTIVSFLPASPGAKFTMAGLGPDAKFSFTYLVPGSYVVIAAPGPAFQFPYRDPEALRALSAKGVQITVAPGASQEISVPLADATALELP